MLYKTVTIILCLCANIKGFPFGERIVNGTTASPGEFPQIVSLRLRDLHNCGATILNNHFLLTAAHCVSSTLPYYDVQYGLSHIVSGANAPNLINVSQYIKHENYVPNHGYFNDIALIQLATPLTFDEHTRPIRLAQAFAATPANSPATVIGWGYPYGGGGVMEDLQKVSIVVSSDDDCERIHKTSGPTDRHYHVCAGVPEGGKGQCSGDSGGPLFVNGAQTGIVSWSVLPCGVKGYPGVYTKVSSYIGWIQNKMAEAGFENF